MGRQSIPDQQDQAVLLMLMQCVEKLDQAFSVVGARTRLEDEVRAAPVGFVDQCTGDGQPLPSEAVVQYRSLASGRPGRPYRRQERNAGLIFEHDQCVLAPGRFFNCGQRFLTQRWMASSLRSIARRAGRCQVQSNWLRRRYHTCPG